MRKGLLLVVCLLIYGGLHARQEQDSAISFSGSSRLYLKSNIYSLIEPEAAVTLALEYRKDKHAAYQLEAGYIFWDMLESRKKLNGVEGYRLKPEWRIYNPGRRGRHPYTNYVALEAVLKWVGTRLHGFAGQDCGPNGCAYYRDTNYRELRRVAGMGIKIGYEDYLGRRRRLIMDLYAGSGLRYRWRDLALPAHLQSRRWDVLQVDRTAGWLPYLSAGMKVGLRLH